MTFFCYKWILVFIALYCVVCAFILLQYLYLMFTLITARKWVSSPIMVLLLPGCLIKVNSDAPGFMYCTCIRAVQLIIGPSFFSAFNLATLCTYMFWCICWFKYFCFLLTYVSNDVKISCYVTFISLWWFMILSACLFFFILYWNFYEFRCHFT